jgi:hypothetical protein
MGTPRPATFPIREWLAGRLGCGPDDLRFAGMESLRPDSQTIRFSLDGDRDYRVRVAKKFAFGLRRRWVVIAEWPNGSAMVTTSDPPEW